MGGSITSLKGGPEHEESGESAPETAGLVKRMRGFYGINENSFYLLTRCRRAHTSERG